MNQAFGLSVFVITGYLITVILCMVIEAPLLENSNRAGKLAILTVVASGVDRNIGLL